MKRGDLVTVAAGGVYAGKPRPAVIVQSDDFSETGSVTLCLLTGEMIDAPIIRLPLVPDDVTNLRKPTWIMVDKIVTVRRDQIGNRIGRLPNEATTRLNRALAVFLGLVG